MRPSVNLADGDAMQRLLRNMPCEYQLVFVVNFTHAPDQHLGIPRFLADSAPSEPEASRALAQGRTHSQPWRYRELDRPLTETRTSRLTCGFALFRAASSPKSKF